MKNPPPKKKDPQRFRKMQAMLDELGYTTCIDRVSKKHFVLTINGEAIKAFKRRQSCNKRIEKLLNETRNPNPRN